LTPDQAFAIGAGSNAAEDRVQVVWRIADGYYMYRSKFRFLTDTPGVALGSPVLPPSVTKNDPIFGDVEIYRDEVVVELPVTRAANAPDVITLKARSQGCADAGLCYPPHTQTVLVALTPAADAPAPVDPRMVEEMRAAIDSSSGSNVAGAAAEPAAEAPAVEEPVAGDGALEEPAAAAAQVVGEQAAGGDPIAELAGLGGALGLDEDDGILAPEEAFRFTAEVRDGNTLRLLWQIAEGTYLYQDKIAVAVAGEGVRLGALELPAPEIKKDSIKPDGSFGDVAVYHEAIDVEVPLLRSSAAPTEIAPCQPR
ncbi:MAG: protein-disulfide reductase DsbD N-terminal domain-containing protein, partial [Gammaproteobacteria bacterium]